MGRRGPAVTPPSHSPTTPTPHANTHTPNNNKIEELCQNPRTPIMALAPVTGKIKIYYAFKNLGGTRVRNMNKIVALEGAGPRASPLFFPEEGILSTCNVRIPSVEDLTAARDSDTFRNLAPATGARRVNFKQSNYCILPPFLAESILNTQERDPANLALILKSSVDDFDNRNRDEEEENEII